MTLRKNVKGQGHTVIKCAANLDRYYCLGFWYLQHLRYSRLGDMVGNEILANDA